MAVEPAGKWEFQIRNKQEQKKNILKHDHVPMQASLVNKMQKSCGEGQSLSNMASEKLFQNTKFSRDIPEVSTALYNIFFYLNKLLKLERNVTDITAWLFTGTREKNSAAASLDEEVSFLCLCKWGSSAINLGKLTVHKPLLIYQIAHCYPYSVPTEVCTRPTHFLEGVVWTPAFSLDISTKKKKLYLFSAGTSVVITFVERNVLLL